MSTAWSPLDSLRALTPEEIAARRLTLPVGQDFWVFGYGSLMWHPGFPHVEVRRGRLYGYHRRFCVYSHRYRGTPETPGLVLGLDRGGSCNGLVFRVPEAEGPETMDYLFEREMVTGVYKPGWLPVETDRGRVTAACFVVDPDHEQYAGKLSREEIVELVIQGNGMRGPCRDYLANTVRHLDALGIADRRLTRLLKEVEKRCSGKSV